MPGNLKSAIHREAVIGSKGDQYEIALQIDKFLHLIVRCSCPATGICKHIMKVFENDKGPTTIWLSQSALSVDECDSILETARLWCKSKQIVETEEARCITLKSNFARLVSLKQ